MKEFLIKYWGDINMVYNGRLINLLEINHIIRYDNGKKIGVLCYFREKNCFHIVSLNAIESNKGIGSALMDELDETALKEGIQYIQVETTNDNINAIGFYQKRGFDLFSLQINEVEHQRMLKSEIPLIGCNGIFIHHILQFRKFIQ